MQAPPGARARAVFAALRPDLAPGGLDREPLCPRGLTHILTCAPNWALVLSAYASLAET